MSSPIAEFAQVVKDYPTGVFRRGKLRAVDQVTLTLRRGEILGLVGPNRAGKTTLVKMLLSLSQPTAGRVQRLGQPAANRRTLSRVGYVHENHAFPTYLSARALLEYYGSLSLLPQERIREKVPALLEQVGLADRAKEPIGRFSKGMLQRLGIAQALINDPELLVLDEPSEGLDLAGRRMIYDVARDMRQQGRGVLLISHQLDDVEQICDRVAVLVQGRLAKTGSVAKLTKNSSSEQTGSLEKALQKYYE